MRNLFLTPKSFKQVDPFYSFFSELGSDLLASDTLYANLAEANKLHKNFRYSTSSEMIFDSEKSEWRLTVELAGVSKETLKLDVKEGLLLIEGEKTKGLQQGAVKLSYEIPTDCDVEKVEADFTEGVLSLTLPLIEKKAVKTIQFKN